MFKFSIKKSIYLKKNNIPKLNTKEIININLHNLLFSLFFSIRFETKKSINVEIIIIGKYLGSPKE
ncbi:Hypothetical protein CCH01_010240 [Clostridium chauvoei JF4335]|nr:Hypothetical protein CCH01_010240 [Clostridium chauvoei JF4335]